MSVYSSAPAPFAALLEQLTRGMDVEHRFGVKDDAAMTSAKRLVWIPTTGPSTEKARFDIDGGEASHVQLAHFLVEIYGDSLDVVYALHRELDGWLDTLAGPEQGAPTADGLPDRPGYAMGAWKTAPQAIDTGAASWGGVVQVTLKAMAPRRMFGARVVDAVVTEIDVTAPDGTEVEVFVGGDT